MKKLTKEEIEGKQEANIRAVIRAARWVVRLFGTDCPKGKEELREEIRKLSTALQIFDRDDHPHAANLVFTPVRRFLWISTAHLTQNDLAWLRRAHEEGTGYIGHFGIFVYCQDDIDNPGTVCQNGARPENLTRLFQHALDNGCSHVLFDQDAEPDPSLRTFVREKETA